ncbi:hypothetical protein AB0H03_06635 [Streptomyces sparsogenes]|uniref:hypothetical protein n=1 Tax=Streptomyces sparsogenes TaxID=67365 RepID=UPI0033C3AA21
MGRSTNAVLAYGYDLGGSDEWKIRESGEYGELPNLAWYDPENEDGDDFLEAAERRLLAEIAGFTETWSGENEGYFEREREAKDRLGVKFDIYCSGEYPMYLLAAHVTTVWRGDIQVIDPARLAADPAEHGWDDKLQAALTALGITPTQDRARWLLCSYWG